MRSAEPVSVEAFSSVQALADDVAPLLRGVTSIFLTPAWWRTVAADAMPPGTEPCFLLCRVGGRASVVLPMQRQGSHIDALTTPYTCVYAPIMAPDLTRASTEAAFTALGRHIRRAGAVRLDALPVEWPGLDAMLAGLRAAGLRALRFDHFGNWHEDVTATGWTAYLAGRPGALRETIRRRLRRAERTGGARFALVTEPADVAGGVAAYESVYARSWKEAEPFPRFNGQLMHAMAADGALRLGLWWLDDVPAAVQFWVVRAGYATVLKLAHDEAFKAHSPGTVLSALMIRHLLDIEGVHGLDFGRGDDPYKQGWVADRRQRIGLLLANPLHPRGQVALARHALGRLRDRVRPAG